MVTSLSEAWRTRARVFVPGFPAFSIVGATMVTWRQRSLGLLVIGLALAGGCTAGGPTDSPTGWASVETTSKSSDVLIQKVTYRSGDLDVVGQVCRPAARGRHPVIIWNHGGFGGLADWNDMEGQCARAARSGWVYAESSYRGEDESDGEVEVCLGEVDDVLALLEIVRDRAYADASRVAMGGISHGGCITAMAVARDAPVQVAVDIAGPTDWAELWKHLSRSASTSTDPQPKATFGGLAARIARATGGTPAEKPAEYAMRSPLNHAAKISDWGNSFLLMHGADDTVVPVGQSCRLAEAIEGAKGFGVDHGGQQTREAPPGCGGLDWMTTGIPGPSYSEGPYLFVYQGMDHLLQGANRPRLNADYLGFVSAKLGK